MAVVDNEKEKTTFDTGAIRAVGNGKGRFDLMPIEIYAAYLSAKFNINTEETAMFYLAEFQKSGSVNSLFAAIEKFRIEANIDKEDVGLQVAVQFEEGEKKYPSEIIDGRICLNAYKGLPLNCFLDSACRHYLKFRKGLTDERHDRAFFWNVFMAIWTVHYRPDCSNICFPAFVGKQPKTEVQSEERV